MPSAVPTRRRRSTSAAVVDGRVDAWSALAAERTVELVAEVDDGLVASATPGRLEQVLDNLLANALEVAPPRPGAGHRAPARNGAR